MPTGGNVTAMAHTRRDFVKALGAGAIGLTAFGRTAYAVPGDLPFPEMRNPQYRTWSDSALKAAKALGCTYADIRFTRNRQQTLNVRNGRLTGGFQSYGGFGEGGGGGGGAATETYGFGVRVIHSGVWGFASSPIVAPEEIARVVALAAEVAKASAIAKKMDVKLAPVPAFNEFWQAPFEKDPFDIPLEEKIAYLTSVTSKMQENKGVMFATAQAGFKREWKFLATSEGSFIEQNIYYTTASCSATARNGGQVKTRTYSGDSSSVGYEHVTKTDMLGHAERVASEAVEFAAAKPVTAGLKDLILLPSHLQLTIHEIIAHPTELDRIVGYEANYAGTSFIGIKDLGKLKYGSKHFNIVADRTYPGAMGTVGFDDDGVKSQKWQIVKDGILVGLTTNRETAHYIGETSSRGCTFANHWRNYPFLRMPNIQMEPGPAGSPTVDQMIADIKDGVLVDGTGSFSIDQQRYNGQFGGNAFWEIKNGKKTRMVTDFTYNAITTDFWANLDAVGPPESWEHHGMNGDAKGQPVQSNWPSHGSSPCLIRKVMVGAAFS
jgi:TldD protein